MEIPSSNKFATHADTSKNPPRASPNCCIQTSVLRAMHEDENKTFCDLALYGVAPQGMQPSSLHPIRAHKNILAYASKHLHDLLTSEGYTDSHQSVHHIENVDHESLSRIVDFVYTEQLTINADENAVDVVCRILTGAKYLIIKCLADTCENFLDDTQINPKNCVKLWRFARKYSCLELMHATSTFIAKNAEILPKDAEFLRMPYDDLAKLLSSEAMISSDADQRCLAAVAWLEYDSNGRASCVSEVLNMVPLKFDSLTPDTILDVSESELLWKSVPHIMRKLTTDSLKKMKTSNSACSGDCSSLLSHPKKCWFAVGGEKSRLFLQYDTNQRIWTRLPDLPWERVYTSACAIRDQNRLIVLGGEKSGKYTNDIDEFNVRTKTWSSTIVKLSMARSEMASCSDGRNMFVLGGFNGHPQHVFEKFCGDSNQIVKLADFKFSARYFLTAAAVCNDRIYTVGGYGSNNTGFVDMYDSVSNGWHQVRQLNKIRYNLASTLSDDEFYLIGGCACGSFPPSKMVTVFNIRTGQLSSPPNLLEARKGCSATTLNGGNVVCVVGGEGDGKGKYLSTVETFDKREGKWASGVIVPNMPEGNACFGFAAL